jgi:ATPase subunit of ABC transporter with duplicated ATPase domains
VRHLLGDLGLSKDLALHQVKTLSAGQRVRLWLARQLLLHPQPSRLILDEISENLDVETRQSLLEMLESFEGAVFAISHDPDFCGSFSKFLTKTWRLWLHVGSHISRVTLQRNHFASGVVVNPPLQYCCALCRIIVCAHVV